MSNVQLSIGGRAYTVACDAGEEAHLGDMARLVDAKLAAMPGARALGETRALLFAALFLAEDVLQACSAHGLTGAAPAASTAPPGDLANIATRLEALAERLDRPA